MSVATSRVDFDRPLRVDMALPALPHGGMEMVVARLASRLVDAGHDVGVTCLERGGPMAQHFRDRGIDVQVIPTLGLRTNVRAPALEAHFRRRAPDVVHSHSGVWLKAAHAARRAGVPRVVHTVHGLLDREPWHGPVLKRLASRLTDTAVAVSTPLRDYLRGECHIPDGRLCTIPNGVDTTMFAPESRDSGSYRERRTEIAGDWARHLLISHVARLVPIKNQVLLLNAFRRVVNAMPDVRLLIAGEGPLAESLAAHAASLGLTDHVRFLGARGDVAHWLRSLDVFVLSSDAEGTSMSVLEALSSGVCVVATDVGGTADLLDRGRTGVLVPPGDVSSLADALIRVLRDNAYRHALAAAGRAFAVAHYDEASVALRYMDLYRSRACA
jgi:glycosyltransferase involved in cell wall biosynthesis